MISAKGNGQSECYECKKRGKWSLNWTSFLYRTEKDNYEHLYCYECAKKLEEEKPMLRKEKIIKIIQKIIIAISIVIALYVGIWVMFAGGIIQIVNGISPLNGTDIAIGILKIVFCEIAVFIPILGLAICDLLERI